MDTVTYSEMCLVRLLITSFCFAVNMFSERAVAAADPRLHRPYAWFDPEAAAVRSGHHSPQITTQQCQVTFHINDYSAVCNVRCVCVCAGGDHPVGAVPVGALCPAYSH